MTLRIFGFLMLLFVGEACAAQSAKVIGCRVPGILVSRDTSRRIRCCSRSFSESSKPLLVIDGVIYPLDHLNSMSPSQVDSIVVLKSAAAMVIYGPDGVNGAIMVTTKGCSKLFRKEEVSVMP